MAHCEPTLILAAIFIPLFLLYRRLNRNSPPITNWPLVGMLPGLLYNASRFTEFASDVIIRNGGTWEFKGPWFPSLDFVMTADLMNVNHILCKKFDCYNKGSEYNEIFSDAMGDGIFNANSDSWKLQRKTLLLLVQDKKFPLFFQRILCEKLEKSLIMVLEQFMKFGIEFDLQDVLQRFNYDISCMLAVGVDPDSLSVELSEVPSKTAFTQAEDCLLQRNIIPIRLWKLQRWLQIGAEKKMTEALKTADDFLYQCIAAKREQLRSKVVADEDKLEFITAFMVQEEEETSDKFLRDVGVNIMAAGKDTISAGLSWFFWLVATKPSVETKILQEIKTNSPSNNDTDTVSFMNGEKLKQFVYLEAVLCETLRLYPPVPLNHKTAIRPDILPSDHRIHQNTRILINYYAMGRRKEIWGEDCMEFKPERWISEQGDIVHEPSYKFIAFNAGPRSCVGKNMSFIQMKLVAISVLRNYQIQVVRGHHVSPSNSVVLHMKNGLKVRIQKRSHLPVHVEGTSSEVN